MGKDGIGMVWRAGILGQEMFSAEVTRKGRDISNQVKETNLGFKEESTLDKTEVSEMARG